MLGYGPRWSSPPGAHVLYCYWYCDPAEPLSELGLMPPPVTPPRANNVLGLRRAVRMRARSLSETRLWIFVPLFCVRCGSPPVREFGVPKAGSRADVRPPGTNSVGRNASERARGPSVLQSMRWLGRGCRAARQGTRKSCLQPGIEEQSSWGSSRRTGADKGIRISIQHDTRPLADVPRMVRVLRRASRRRASA